MNVLHIKQYFFRVQQRIRSEKVSRRLVAIASVVIVIVFFLSVYVFIVDLTMGISQEQELLITVSRGTVLAPGEEMDMQKNEIQAIDHVFAKPQGAVTPIPIKLQ